MLVVFAGLPAPSTYGARVSTDAILCVGKAVGNAREQNGDSGGAVYVPVGPDKTLVQAGIVTGSYFADEFGSWAPSREFEQVGAKYIGSYTRTDWPTIKPWLAKILAGDIAGAKAMTCASLGGMTLPNPNPNRNRRRRQLVEEQPQAAAPAHTPSTRRSLYSGNTQMAAKQQVNGWDRDI